jgi:acetyltransferase
MAQKTGFPVVMRPNAFVPQVRNTVLTRRNLNDADAASHAYEEIANELRQRSPESIHYGICIEHAGRGAFERELMVRVWRDPVLGPVIGFGERSLDADYWPDRAVALPPLNAYLVSDLIQGTRAAKIMAASEDMPAARVDLIEDILLRISEMICELPWIQSLELNPLRVDEQQAVVADARITIGSIPAGAGRYDHMAIHPYPSDLISHCQLKDGTDVLVRPLKPEDAELEQRFVQGLSPETRYFRFMSAVRELPPAFLAKLTQIDYDREIALIATIEQDGEITEIGVCRYATNPDGQSCEFAIVIADKWQKSGLGRYLMTQLINAAHERGLQAMKGVFLASNERMLRFAQSFGFVLSADKEAPSMKHGVLDLTRVAASK